jgi:hypothetical protein
MLSAIGTILNSFSFPVSAFSSRCAGRGEREDKALEGGISRRLKSSSQDRIIVTQPIQNSSASKSVRDHSSPLHHGILHEMSGDLITATQKSFFMKIHKL